MIWPKAKRWDNVCSQGVDACLTELARQVKAVSAAQPGSGVTSSATEQHEEHYTNAESTSMVVGSSAAAEPDAARQLADAMWSKFGASNLLPAASKSSARFSHLVCHLGMDDMVAKMLDKLKVVCKCRWGIDACLLNIEHQVQIRVERHTNGHKSLTSQGTNKLLWVRYRQLTSYCLQGSPCHATKTGSFELHST